MSSGRAASGVVTLTTDFGLKDHYVGTMKGVIAGIAPNTTTIDITHGVPPQDIAEGAFAIAQAFAYFPERTVHLVVVDPGVGSSRRPVAITARGHTFVAPDNGVLSQVIEDADFEARVIDPQHGLAEISRTFHGRDLFAPAAARLAAGLPFGKIGEFAGEVATLPATKPSGCIGRVLHIDIFGNLVTSFHHADLAPDRALQLAGERVEHRCESYAEARHQEPFLIEGSSGYVEISIKQDSAAIRLKAKAGDPVRII